ncbi:MAG: TSUP family transporter [Actinomycetota bacterium]
MNGLDLVAEAEAARREVQRGRARQALGVSIAVTAVWAVWVTAAGHWDRIADQWAAAVTMVFGSFVAGSTPQGGGAVAFPVFTKLLDVPAEVARSFSLSIQTVGMGTATAAILLRRRAVQWRLVAISVPAAVVAFAVVAWFGGDGDAPFRPSVLPGAYVKVTFTLVLAAMALVVVLGRRVPVRVIEQDVDDIGSRLVVAGLVAGAIGGAASALVGSGADVVTYLLVVVLVGLDPRIGVPTSVVAMTAVSATGFVLLGLVDGHLSIELTDGMVTAVGDVVPDEPLDAGRADLFGLWLAAMPVVAWGAPLGSAVAASLSVRHLVWLVVGLAVAETISTIVFLDELRTDAGLAAYAVVGAVVATGGLLLAVRHRRWLLGLPAFDRGRTYRRSDVEIDADYADHLDADHHLDPADVPEDRHP